MKKKIIGIFVCILLIATGVVPISSTISQSVGKESSTVEIPDSHIIENIPYVCQGDTFYCIYASLAMIFQYYGLNTSLFEVCFNSGVGYSLGYRIKNPCHSIFSSLMSQEAKDRQFLADIYGLNYSYWHVNDDWQLYWTSVKENISKDIPVTTEVWIQELPYYEEDTAWGAHTIVLSGYNETNNTVCVHDSDATIFNTSMRSGAYIYIPIDFLKNALIVSSDKKYLFETFVDTIEKPLPKKEAFELAHSRNIQRMKGDATYYDEEFIRYNMGGTRGLITIFGLHALKWLKHSYNIRNILMFSIMDRITGSYYLLSESDNCWFMYWEKLDMFDYLYEHLDFFPNLDNAFYYVYMLNIDAACWGALCYKISKLTEIPIFRIPLLISVVPEIRAILDDIISIEKDIIAGPHSIVAS